MKYILLLSLSLTIFIASAQKIKKVELSKQEIEKVVDDLVLTYHSTPENELYKSVIKNNNKLYCFEIIYKNKVIYRGGLNKAIPKMTSFAFNEPSFEICLDYSVFDQETKLEILEGESLEVNTLDSGEKYLCNSKFELFEFKKNFYKKKSTVIAKTEIASTVFIKYYEIKL